MSKYIFTKTTSLEKPHNLSKEEFASASYGQEFIYNPKDRVIKSYLLSGSAINEDNKYYRQLRSLKNIINYYRAHDDMFNFDKFYNHPCALHCLYSTHFGSGIKPGSVEFSLYYSGSLISSISDKRNNGVLYDSSTDEEVGIILYKEGFILINHTGSLNNENIQFQEGSAGLGEIGIFTDNLKWIYSRVPTQYPVYTEIGYQLNNDVATNISFVYAEKNELNHSNNFTYLESSSYSVLTSSTTFTEDPKINIKNIIKSPFVSGSAQPEKQTYITNIGLYDANKKLIAVANLANPVKKTENREYLFKLKIDI